ncbi:MAG: MarR family transcriptional regulator [Rhodospirillales bacterium]|nr:MarR family transcriptional regulator [Rhodospirillales bacterium]MDE2319629.1 MarR family transcriptional regulator [Rhodospirillales bacterium]
MDIGSGEINPAFAQWMQSPGFLVRRLNQIYLALFAEEAAGFEITPAQHSVLGAIARHGGRDQSAIAEEIGLDRATLASVAARLEAAGLIRRSIGRADQRQKLMDLTPRGKTIVAKMQKQASRADKRAMAPLDPAEQELLLSLLTILVNGGNEHARAKMRLQPIECKISAAGF